MLETITYTYNLIYMYRLQLIELVLICMKGYTATLIYFY